MFHFDLVCIILYHDPLIKFDGACHRDGYPIEVYAPIAPINDEGIGAQGLRSGKYNTTVYKGHMGIGFHGPIFANSGLHLGRDHDAHMLNDMNTVYARLPGEWHLGDLGYEGCDGVLIGHKKVGVYDYACEFWTNLIGHYRGRCENIINRVKSHAWTDGPFRGRFETMCQYNEISVVMTALELKMDFELDDKVMFEVTGPWPHEFCP